MAPIQSKFVDTDSTATVVVPGKLWTNEERMFCEKLFYLNKSTTKHLIAGYDALNFEPLVRICDRVTGSYITLRKEHFTDFIGLIDSILNNTYIVERGIVRRPGDASGINVKIMGRKTWKLSQVDLPHAVIIVHENSLKVVLRIARLVMDHLSRHDAQSFDSFIRGVTLDTPDLPLDELVERLYSRLETYHPDSTEHTIISDLICNIESYSKLSKFGDAFYCRTKNIN